MRSTSRPLVLLTTLLMAAAPVWAEGIVIVNPNGDTAVPLVVPTVITPGTTIVLKPGTGVTVTPIAPINVGLKGIVAWGTTTQGPAWVDIAGMALYTYEQDPVGVSLCTGDCAVAWPPLAAEAGVTGADEWTVVTREDKTSQWAYRGHPLYTYVKDTMPGQVTGDGAAGFHLAN